MAAFTLTLRRAVLALLYVGVGAAVIFFGLTRTQVGREGLRLELMRQADQAIEGRIEIGELRGNLLNDLFARDVRLLDAEGRAVLVADSAIVRPSWRALFDRSVSLRQVVLVRPRLDLVRTEAGTWNLADALRRPPRDTLRVPWAFDAADVRIIDGTVTTRSDAALPPAVAEGRVFNYADASVRDVDARLAVAWGAAERAVAIDGLTGHLAPLDLAVDTLQGRLGFGSDELLVDDLLLRAGDTRISGRAALGRPFGRWQSPVDVDLEPSTLDNAALRRILPWWPLRDQIEVAADVNGRLSDLAVSEAWVRRGATRLAVEGTMRGLPGEAVFDGRTDGRLARAADLAAVWPGAPVDRLRSLGESRMRVEAAGRLAARDGWPGSVETTLEVTTGAGALAGTMEYRRPSGAAPPRISGDVRVSDLDLIRLLPSSALQSDVNGRAVFDLQGTTTTDLTGTLDLRLRPTTLAGRQLDTARVALTANEGLLDADVFAVRAGGVVRGQGTVDARTPRLGYTADLATEGLDLGPLLGLDSLRSDLNTRLAVEGAGWPGRAFDARFTADVDSSAIGWGGAQRVLAPHQTTIALRPAGDPGPRLEISGDALAARLYGEARTGVLLALGELWGRALVEAVREEVNKPYDEPMPDTLGQTLAEWMLDLPPPVPVDAERLRSRARALFARDDLGDSTPLAASVEVRRADLLSAYLPMAPRIDTDLQLRLDGSLSPDRLVLAVDASADSVRAAGIRLDEARATVEAEGRVEEGGQLRLTLAVDAAADSMGVRDQRLARASVGARYEDRSGALAVRAVRAGSADTLAVDAALDVRDDRNAIRLQRVRLDVAGQQWRNPTPSVIDLYDHAVVIRDLLLTAVGSEGAQRVQLSGTLSAAPGDSVVAVAEGFQLAQLSDVAGLKRPVAGRLDGRLVLTGGIRRPAIAGALTVDPLTYDDRLLGRLQATSRFVPGTPDVAVEVALAPKPGDPPAGLRPEPLDLQVAGTVRLPQQEGAEQGRLDLRFDAARLDLFIFEYLFPTIVANVEGAAAGDGRVRGTFGRPVFEADLAITEAAFEVPEFNLAYAAGGRVRVDRAGISLDGVEVRDGGEGTAALEGDILFNDYRFFSLDLRGRLDELLIIDVASSTDLPFYGRIRASGDATLTGPITDAVLRSADAATTPDSEIFIPVADDGVASDPGFLIFADSSGAVPDLEQYTRRRNVLAERAPGERTFLSGLSMDLNIQAPRGSTVHLVIDPLVGDVISAVGFGRLQLLLREGEFQTFGALTVTGGDYLFTAGDVFVRRFLIEGGTLVWDGDPLDATLAIDAAYRTRASRAGLPAGGGGGLIPLVVELGISGRVSAPLVDLSLALDQRNPDQLVNAEGLEAALNQPERATEYATSVLLTNSFLLTTDVVDGGPSQPGATNTLGQFAFTSLSQLVTSQVNRYLSRALPGVDLMFGFQGERAQDLDVTYGVAFRLLDERLVIRGEGVYQSNEAERTRGEFVAEVRLSPSVSVEVFYRREGDVLTDQALQSTRGAGLSYQTQFATWPGLWRRLVGTSDRPSSDPAVATRGER